MNTELRAAKLRGILDKQMNPHAIAMEHRLARILASLRGRPAHERRILAVATFAASAAMVLALWTVSFRASLSPELPQDPEVLRASREASPAPAPSELTSPFETIRGSLRAAATGIKDFAAEIRSLGDLGKNADAERGEEANRGERGARTPDAVSAQEVSEPAKTPPTAASKPAVQHPPEAANPSAVLGLVPRPERESGFRLASLLASRRNSPEAAGEAHPLRTRLSGGFEKLRRAAGEFFQGLGGN